MTRRRNLDVVLGRSSAAAAAPASGPHREPALAPRSGVKNIGDVLSILQEDFPAVTASKIRFLEEKGLITPARTAAGYRKYTASDVERLRFILALQRDQYLPLKVIKEHLDAVDAGENPQALPGGTTIAPRVLDEVEAEQIAGHVRPLTRAELAGRAGASVAFVDELTELGMITADEDELFDSRALQAVVAALRLAEYGVQPRHLRLVRTAAERESALIESVVTSSHPRRDSTSSARAADQAETMAEALSALHRSMLYSRIDHFDR